MGVISIRLSDNEEARLQAAGIRPAAEAKRWLLTQLHRAEVEQAHRRLVAASVPYDGDLAADLRADRESH